MSNDSVVGQTVGAVGDTITKPFNELMKPLDDLTSHNDFNISGGDNSVLNSGTDIFGGENSFFRKPLGSKPGDPALPDAPPDPQSIRQGELQGQLKDEQAHLASRTLFTGGLGLLDKPTTASHILLGS